MWRAYCEHASPCKLWGEVIMLPWYIVKAFQTFVASYYNNPCGFLGIMPLLQY